MPNQAFSLYTTLHYFDDNEWLTSIAITRIRELWEKSNKSIDDPGLIKALSSIKPHITANFDRQRIVDKISDLIAPVDEDGWRDADEASLIYGLRKSIFAPIDLDTYEPDEINTVDIINIQFYDLNDDDELDESKISNAMTITLSLTVTLPVKTMLTLDDLEIWVDKFDIDLANVFRIELSDSLTTFIDDDGYEVSSVSSTTLNEGVLMAPADMSIAELRETARHHAVTGDSEFINISETTISILNAVKTSNIPMLMELLQHKNIDRPLIDGVESSAVLPLMFGSLLDTSKELEDSLNALNEDLKFEFPDKVEVIEIIYALASMGGNLQYRLGGVMGYLEVAIIASNELTEFLLSFGLDSLGDSADALLLAAELGRVDLVNRFISDGANVNHATESGTTALLLASQGPQADHQLADLDVPPYIAIVTALVSAGASINVIDDGGDGALSNAARVNSQIMCDHLIKLGVGLNPHLSYVKALSPAEVAREKGYDLAKYLISLGAELNSGEKEVSKSSRNAKNVTAKAKARSPAVGKKTRLSEIEQLELLDTLKLGAKADCIGCEKKFSVKTLKSWKGRCSKCYKKVYGAGKTDQKPATTKKAKSSIAKVEQNKSTIGGFFRGVSDFMDAVVEMIKALLLLGFGLSIVVFIIAVIFF